MAGEDLVGTVVGGKYRVVRRVGGGAVADVYEAVHEQIGGRLALKILRREFARFPDVSRRFLNEARAAGAIGHPGIVQVFDIGQLDSGELFMVMELLQGQDLGALLMAQGRFEATRAVGIAAQLLDALEAAHQAGVIHRDLKPENVLVSRGPGGEDWIKIIDFGIARLTQESPTALRRTAEGSVLGSPYYMSPEQAAGQSDLDLRTDLYSLGVMLYEMLTGELPYTGLSITAIVEKVLHEPFPRLRDAVPALPEALEAAILTATARQRDQRFATAREFADALQPFRGEAGARPPSPQPLPADVDRLGPVAGSATIVVVPTRVYAVATVVAILAALAVVALLTLFGRDGDERRGAPPVPPDTGLPSFPAGAEASAPDSVPADAASAADTGSSVAFAVDAGGPGTVDSGTTPVSFGDAAADATRAKVVLLGLPAGARATLDGKPVEGEFEIEPSDVPRLLEVTARGWKTHRQELRIGADLVVELRMERREDAGGPPDAASPPPPDAGDPVAPQPDVAEPPPPPPPPADAGVAAPPDAGSRDSVGFVPNPFGDA